MIKLIRKMPQDPEKRNFWEILKNYKKKIPKETYDYVFYIVSAAVIGENPRLFGFDFDNPLALAVNKLARGYFFKSPAPGGGVFRLNI